MRILKLLGFMALGAIVMIACLLWISQFFGPQDDVTPVIWLEALQDPEQESSDKDPLQPAFQDD